MFHDETLKGATRYSQGPVTVCKAGFAVTDPQNSGEVFEKSDDGLLAEFEKGGDFGGGEVFGFHAGRVAGKGRRVRQGQGRLPASAGLRGRAGWADIAAGFCGLRAHSGRRWWRSCRAMCASILHRSSRSCARHANGSPAQGHPLRGGTEHSEAPPLDQDWPIPEDWSIHVERAMEPPPPASPVLQLQQLEQQQQ
jgi:hypothetical protein